jgi:DNA polymerase-3 subunit delta
MAALKGAEIDSYIARPDQRPIVLVYGADAGLVRERVEALLGAAVDDMNDPFALVRMEGDTLAASPERLLEEAHTVPLLGGRRALWIKAGGSNIGAAVEALLADPPQEGCRIVIEAGDLRKTAPLRTLVEQAKGAVALACYADNERDLARLIAEELRSAKLTIAPDAQTLLVSLLGGDRQASRSEIRKLALYGHGKARIEADDVLAVVADASTLAIDGVVDAAFAGRIQVFDSQYARARTSGISAATMLSAAARQAAQLHRTRLEIEAGKSIDAAIRQTFRPPLFFRREPLVKAALAVWTAARLEQTMVQFAEASLASRRWPIAAEPTTHRALLAAAMNARVRGV